MTSVVGVIKFNQIPNVPTMIGLCLIIVGVLTVNLLGQTATASDVETTEVVE